jgi:hypothetical protein
MAKERLAIPRATQDKVLSEYNHRCAVCGADKPHFHHIDENPSNNDPMNLIPLCPNHHLTDQHDPTRAIEPEKLKLFRQFKDPAILKTQFHPLFVRLRFLDYIDTSSDALQLENKAKELVNFVAALEMGSFYSNSISGLTKRPPHLYFAIAGDDEVERKEKLKYELHLQQYLEKLRSSRDEVYALCVELLRFQNWQ